jgi:hypothetical protein
MARGDSVPSMFRCFIPQWFRRGRGRDLYRFFSPIYRSRVEQLEDRTPRSGLKPPGAAAADKPLALLGEPPKVSDAAAQQLVFIDAAVSDAGTFVNGLADATDVPSASCTSSADGLFFAEPCRLPTRLFHFSFPREGLRAPFSHYKQIRGIPVPARPRRPSG